MLPAKEKQMNASDIINNNLNVIDSVDAPFTDDGEIIGLRTVTTEDWEEERFNTVVTDYELYQGYWTPVYEEIPTWAFRDNASAYFTTTGDNPATKPEAEAADEGSRLMKELAPAYTPTSTQWAWGKEADRFYMQWMMFIRDNDDNAKLRRGWKSLWKKFFACKESGEQFPLSPVQLKNVKAAFNAKGIKARGRKQ